MKWFKGLFGINSSRGAHGTHTQVDVPTEQHRAALVQNASTQSSWRTASSADFVANAAVGAAYCRIPLTQIPDMAERLGKELMERGVPSSEMTDLFNNSLLGVCPECRQYCAGGLMLSLTTFSAIGAGNITFMTDTAGGGPKQRLLGGQCGNSSCSNRDSYHLFWCPDLHPEMLQYVKAHFGVELDPNTQAKRTHVWRPTERDSTAAITPTSVSESAQAEIVRVFSQFSALPPPRGKSEARFRRYYKSLADHLVAAASKKPAEQRDAYAYVVKHVAETLASIESRVELHGDSVSDNTGMSILEEMCAVFRKRFLS